MPRISSSDNPRLKEAARLIASSRERRKSGRCVLEGEHLVDVYCRRYGPPESLLVAESAVEWPTVRALLSRVPPARTLIVAESAWAELAQLPAAVGLLAVVAAPVPGVERAADFCLLLDGVQDPGNLGTLIRTAHALGAAATIVLRGTADPMNAKALRGAMGATFRHPVVPLDDAPFITWARQRGLILWAAAVDGVPLARALDASTDREELIAVIVGNEGAGIRPQLNAVSAQRVAIPLARGAESLNVAVAAGILLYEVLRGR